VENWCEGKTSKKTAVQFGEVFTVDKPAPGEVCSSCDGKGWDKILVQIDSGAIDTDGPKEVATAFTIEGDRRVEEGHRIRGGKPEKRGTYGDKKVVGHTDSGEAWSMKIQRAV
jgi:hypothetical protein